MIATALAAVACYCDDCQSVAKQIDALPNVTRELASCCNSNMTTRFDHWLPITALRTHSINVDLVKPELCIHTKFAPDPTNLLHTAARHYPLASSSASPPPPAPSPSPASTHQTSS